MTPSTWYCFLENVWKISFMKLNGLDPEMPCSSWNIHFYLCMTAPTNSPNFDVLLQTPRPHHVPQLSGLIMGGQRWYNRVGEGGAGTPTVGGREPGNPTGCVEFFSGSSPTKFQIKLSANIQSENLDAIYKLLWIFLGNSRVSMQQTIITKHFFVVFQLASWILISNKENQNINTF